MKRKSNVKLPYKVDRRNKEAYQIVLSRFSPKINDFNALLLCVGEGIVRLGKVTNGIVLLTDVDYDPDLSKALSFDHDVYPAISRFLEKTVWGSKEKALSIILGEAVQAISANDGDTLNTLIAVGSAEWEELGAYSLPGQSLAGSVSSLPVSVNTNMSDIKPENTLSKDVESILAGNLDVDIIGGGHTEPESEAEVEAELEVDLDLLGELAAEFDMEMLEDFNGEEVDDFQA